ncbi:hypothetical protein F5877DRAFT_68559 [Lentinula edodes]|nr:hypothetical protein F5877DRAFT_68559 [Lentinula edodes]
MAPKRKRPSGGDPDDPADESEDENASDGPPVTPRFSKPQTAKKTTGGKAPKKPTGGKSVQKTAGSKPVRKAAVSKPPRSYKQTASRSTGGPAPLMTLGPPEITTTPPLFSPTPSFEPTEYSDNSNPAVMMRKSSRPGAQKSYTSYFEGPPDELAENPYATLSTLQNSRDPFPLRRYDLPSVEHQRDIPSGRNSLSLPENEFAPGCGNFSPPRVDFNYVQPRDKFALDRDYLPTPRDTFLMSHNEFAPGRDFASSHEQFNMYDHAEFIPAQNTTSRDYHDRAAELSTMQNRSVPFQGYLPRFNMSMTGSHFRVASDHERPFDQSGYRGRGGRGSTFTRFRGGGNFRIPTHLGDPALPYRSGPSRGRWSVPAPGHVSMVSTRGMPRPNPASSAFSMHAASSRSGATASGCGGNVSSGSSAPSRNGFVASGSAPTRHNPIYVTQKRQDIYCAGCQDGGKLLRCEAPMLYENLPPCGRLICHGPPDSRKCLELTAAATADVLDDPQTALICPSCWLIISGKDKEWDIPYPALVFRSNLKPVPNVLHLVHNTRRSFFNPLDILPLAIVSLSLKGMKSLPYSTTLLHLESFYNDSEVPFLAESIEFDLLNDRKTYDQSLKKLLSKIKSCGIVRVIVFFTTHSTPDGALHFSPGGEQHGASAITSEVLAAVFTDDFRAILSTMDSTLFILACGGAYLFEESYNSIGALAEQRVFDRMVAFPAQDFQPSIASGWCNLFVHRVLLQRESVDRALNGVCSDNTILGSHSQVLVWTYTPTHPLSLDDEEDLQVLVVLKAMWCHAIEAPFGIRMTEVICRQCGVLRKREIVHHDDRMFNPLLMVRVVELFPNHSLCNVTVKKSFSVDPIYLLQGELTLLVATGS